MAFYSNHFLRGTNHNIVTCCALHENEYESQESTKVNAQIDATNILKILQQNKTRFVYVILIGIFSTQDENGNTTEIQAFDLGFNKPNWI